MSDLPQDWSDLAELRQGVYRFFAAALLPPDAHRIESLRAATVTLDSAGIDGLAFAHEWRAAAAVFAAAPSPEALGRDYAALFVSSAGSGACPPIETHYGAAPGRAPLVDAGLQREYAGLGVALRPGSAVPIDHASVQLELMSSLCHDEAHAWSEGRDEDAIRGLRAQWGFLDRHVARWLPRWAADVGVVAGGSGWDTVARGATTFVRHDLDLVTLLTRSTPVSA